MADNVDSSQILTLDRVELHEEGNIDQNMTGVILGRKTGDPVDEFYRMDHDRRGLAIIINNLFDEKNIKPLQKLQRTLISWPLYFDCSKENITKEATREEIQ